jgi:hypothetical protein
VFAIQIFGTLGVLPVDDAQSAEAEDTIASDKRDAVTIFFISHLSVVLLPT